MARVLLLTADLLFGSRVQGQLSAAGEQVQLVPDAASARALLSAQQDAPTVLIADLAGEDLGALELVGSLEPDTRPLTLAFYSHVEADVRARAERAGFDLVVPRSRMAREGAALVAGLAAARRSRNSG